MKIKRTFLVVPREGKAAAMATAVAPSPAASDAAPSPAAASDPAADPAAAAAADAAEEVESSPQSSPQPRPSSDLRDQCQNVLRVLPVVVLCYVIGWANFAVRDAVVPTDSALLVGTVAGADAELPHQPVPQRPSGAP